jgi:hypothetical protein
MAGGVLFLVHLCTFLVKPLFICFFSRAADGVFAEKQPATEKTLSLHVEVG